MASISAEMSTRRRFAEVMRGGRPDRVPLFSEGMRADVLRQWRRQGLPRRQRLENIFLMDRRETFEPVLQPLPHIRSWPRTLAEIAVFERRLNAYDKRRLPRKWAQRVHDWRGREHVLMMYVHEGFFLSLGVYAWRRFREVMDLILDQPALVRRMMAVKGRFCAALLERVLKDVDIDAAVFSEPIGSNENPLISPSMYADLVLQSYEPLLAVLRRFNVKTVVFQTYANARILMPLIIDCGFNCLWSCEAETGAMDYRRLRAKFGRDLKLIGGFDLDVLRRTRADIDAALETQVVPLLKQGGYIPLADGRIRRDIPFENYAYYRRRLAELATAY